MRLAVVLLAAAPIVAQAAAPRWLANGDVLDAATGQSVARLEGKGHGQAAWLAVDQYASGSLVVDLAAGEVLAPMGDALVLSDLAGRERWRAEVAVGAPGEGWPPPRFVGDRVVAILAGGALVGLDRRDGHVVWRRATDGMRLDVDGGLAFVSNLRASELGFELTALAAENGAEAFRVALPGPVDRLAAASHGIAVAAAGQLVVVDRTGPELFRITTPVVDVAAGTRDWFVLTGKELAAFDRSGERRFGIPAAASGIDRCRFVRSASGALLLLHYCRMSDSGFTVTRHDPDDGSVLWSVSEPGLGIAHSKYWHDVEASAIADGVFVKSQGGGGVILVELDGEDGARRSRHDRKR